MDYFLYNSRSLLEDALFVRNITWYPFLDNTTLKSETYLFTSTLPYFRQSVPLWPGHICIFVI